MLGAIIGDIIGSRWEFSPTNEMKEVVEEFYKRIS